MDAIKLGVILDNLLSNAVKFTSGWRKRPSVSFSIVKKRDCWISVFQIQEAESRNKIFHISSSVFPVSTFGNKEGTGIGLYLVKTYTELHGGHINGVTSNEGKGTSIGLNIPVIAVEKKRFRRHR